jgi:hypothetical protein
MAVVARTSAMLPERLLVVLKDIWHGLPAAHALNDPTERTRLLQRVVSMCIREYYREGQA